MNPKVYLIGGPPGAGKTTLGTALAARLGIASLTIDDLVTAVQAVTRPETHPGLHLMWQRSHTDYFTHSAPEKLIEDAKEQHKVAWPFIQQVIRKHERNGAPIVIDGWHLWPERVKALNLSEVWAGWIYIDPAVLQGREEKLTDWTAGSDDPERMLENFLARSFWYNETMRQQATAYGFTVLKQDGEVSVAQLCDLVLGE